MTDVTAKVDASGVVKVFQAMPKVAYFHLRAYMYGSLIDHRLRWLKSKGNKFGRGNKGIKVHRVGDKAGETNKSVVYEVPAKKRASSNEEARDLLAKMGAEIRTGNAILPVHEFGPRITPRSKRWMAINVKGTKPRTPHEWRAANPNKVLVARPTRDSNRLSLLEVSKRRRNTRAKSKAGRWYESRAGGKQGGWWKLRFVLVREAKMKRELRFYETWDELKPEREKKWNRRVTMMLKDWRKADPRDL